ncbi:MAG: hypothetical protein ABIF10_05375 [Candidatus Woesearchaeota archaeon]
MGLPKTLILLSLICMPFAAADNVSIRIINPSRTFMAVCPPNKEYWLQQGSDVDVKLYVRNAMDNKNIKRIYLDVIVDPRISYTVAPDHIENLSTVPGQQVSFFLIRFSAPSDLPSGDYVSVLNVGTDEYMEGAFQDLVTLKVRRYSNMVPFFLGAVVLTILMAVATRYFMIRQANRHTRSQPKLKRKPVSQYYYKK